jgi:hypothetical protein
MGPARTVERIMLQEGTAQVTITATNTSGTAADCGVH